MSAYNAACRLRKPGLPILLLLIFPLVSSSEQAQQKPTPAEKVKSVNPSASDEPPLNFDLRPINLLQGNPDKEAAADVAFMMLSATYSPDGKLLATASDSGIHTWDVATGRRLHTFGTGGYTTVRFSPDARGSQP